jgi:hypothetical protein
MSFHEKFCAFCQTSNPSTHLYCFQCGEALDYIPTTKVVTPDLMIEGEVTRVIPEVPLLENQIKLVIGENTDHLYFRDIRRLVLGRCANSKMGELTLDLTPYGALEQGVSRQHAIIIFRLGQFYILDVGSSNGTYLNGKFLYVNQMPQLKHGDRIQLGRLRIYFYPQPEHLNVSDFSHTSPLPGENGQGN